MQGHDRVLSVEKTTENKFLNMYDLQYENKVGGHGVYHIASRAMSMEELKMKTRENKPDGVIIYSLYGEKKLLLCLISHSLYLVAVASGGNDKIICQYRNT